MKIKILFTVCFIGILSQTSCKKEEALVPVEFECGGVISDIDGNLYKTVQIGDQCWMAENLKVLNYKNGDAIKAGLDDSSWAVNSTGACAVYNNDTSYYHTYGLLYNWFAVGNDRGLCPDGWHVPTDSEWTALIFAIDSTMCEFCPTQSTSAGGAMKATGTLSEGTGLWLAPNLGATNSSGFSAIPAGSRISNGTYYNLGRSAVWWSATETYFNYARGRILYEGVKSVNQFDYIRHGGYAIRCVQDSL